MFMGLVYYLLKYPFKLITFIMLTMLVSPAVFAILNSTITFTSIDLYFVYLFEEYHILIYKL